MTEKQQTEGLVLVRDVRGSLVHVRDQQTGECLGCVEVGLFELLKNLILAAQMEDRKRDWRNDLRA
jgi:hypothetical protein